MPPVCSLATTKTATILAGATGLSDVVDLDGYTTFAIEMPATWVTAQISFQACSTATGTFQDVFDDAGSEVKLTAVQGHVVPLDSIFMKLMPLRFIKLRSGLTGAAVNQTATRVLTLICKG